MNEYRLQHDLVQTLSQIYNTYDTITDTTGNQELRARHGVGVPYWVSRCPAGKARAYREYVSDEQRSQPGCIGGQNSTVIP